MFTDFLHQISIADKIVGAVVVLVSFHSKRCAVGQGLGITANLSADGSRLKPLVSDRSDSRSNQTGNL
jgi:hypothetical protein